MNGDRTKTRFPLPSREVLEETKRSSRGLEKAVPSQSAQLQGEDSQGVLSPPVGTENCGKGGHQGDSRGPVGSTSLGRDTFRTPQGLRGSNSLELD